MVKLFLSIWPSNTMITSTIVKHFLHQENQINKPSKIYPRLFKLCQSGKILLNLVTLVGTPFKLSLSHSLNHAFTFAFYVSVALHCLSLPQLFVFVSLCLYSLFVLLLLYSFCIMSSVARLQNFCSIFSHIKWWNFAQLHSKLRKYAKNIVKF